MHAARHVSRQILLALPQGAENGYPFILMERDLGNRGLWEGVLRAMERHRTMRAYSAGGVVFRLVPIRSSENNYATDLWGSELNKNEIIIARDEDSEERVGQHVLAPLSVEIALVGRSRAGIWALPKGTPKPGETIEQVAIREVQEETGLKVRMIAYIGSISYSFVRDRLRYYKQVRHFLFEAIGGDTALHDQEYDLVEWFPLAEASRRLTYQNEVNILNSAEEILQRWLPSRRLEQS